MNKDIITIYDNNGKKDYKLLFIIEKEYKYIVYTDLNNNNIKENLNVIKIKDNSEECLEITDKEWTMIEKEYNKLLNN